MEFKKLEPPLTTKVSEDSNRAECDKSEWIHRNSISNNLERDATLRDLGDARQASRFTVDLQDDAGITAIVRKIGRLSEGS